MTQDYIYDIFISYRRRGHVFTWVTEYFYPLLENWFLDHTPPDYNVSIFIDRDEIRTGESWSIGLKEALQLSRYLLPIWSPDYFRSDWCKAELHTMLKREEILGLRQGHNASGLIYPVVFRGANHIPSEYRNIMQYKDLSHWGNPWSAFKDSPEFLLFSLEVEKICDDLWSYIQQAPHWQDNWPIITPEELSRTLPLVPSTPLSLPRFS
ncbi:MAG TPA: toll/interleukin-1 receptor domain-containing protein [Ktedonobacteraceae bacterium]|nr:toll/interleukin-1 receptor domain-containing protein [Ktedonobacteraceae bacterium]